MPQLTQNMHWKACHAHGERLKAQHLRSLFAQDAARFEHFHVGAGALTLDISRQLLDSAALSCLAQLLSAQGFEAQRTALFAGEKVNASEGRAALHMALRAEAGSNFRSDGRNVMPDVLAAREKMLGFAEAVRAGAVKGGAGKPFRHVVAVGIGGSDLGPRLLAEALGDGKGPQLHFIMNVDGEVLARLMQALPAEETLVVIASKTFTTAETLRNAETLRGWLQASLKDKTPLHLAATTAAPDKAKAAGILEERIFPFWDWVGGRFSLWSSVGLPAALAMGAARFREFLAGGAAVDAHFLSAPLQQNIPALLALLSIWNINVLGTRARAVLPYTERLQLLPAYLQQLEMESLGKSVDRDGAALSYATAPVVFGMTGTPAQHAFMQALHQGTDIIPAEFILLKHDGAGLPAHHAMLNANALAQAEALAFGRSVEEVRALGEVDAARAAQKTFTGNRPSSLLVLDILSPHALGQLVATYEHKVFTESVLWHLNAFDQWGVELGKVLAGPIMDALAGARTKEEVPPITRFLHR